MSALENLIGQNLIAIETGDDETGLHFSDAIVSAYNLITGENPQKCIGAKVAAIEFIERQELRLMFSNSFHFSISLKESDYVGPEAFCVLLGDGTIIVE